MYSRIAAVLLVLQTLCAAEEAAPEITLGEPVVVAQAPADLRQWGPYQFPRLELVSDKSIHLEYHIEADSATAYGKPVGHAVSEDGGATWKLLKEYQWMGGLKLSNGDRLLFKQQKSIPLDKVKLPAPLETVKGTYNVTYTYYRDQDMPQELWGSTFLRWPKGAQGWKEELAKVNFPGKLRYATEGVFTFPILYQDRMHVAPDGSILAAIYESRMVDGKVDPKWRVMFLRSADQGKTWSLHGEIPFQPDKQTDPSWSKREGFMEPDFCFLPDGSLMCLIRGMDGSGQGPMYESFSKDGGKNWSVPKVFDDLGVWPSLLSLRNGATLSAYGRPGVFVRASSAPSGGKWGPRVEVVKAMGIGQDSCSYTSLIALSDDTALLAYSNFNVPDDKGKPRKTILVRKVTVRIKK